MLRTADEIYVNGVHGDADVLQDKVAFVLAHFHEETTEMTDALRTLKTFFLKATGTVLPDGCGDMLGILPAWAAFDVHPLEALSPSPEDTRIAFVIGKPTAIEVEDGFHIGMEKRYVVGLRIQPDFLTMTRRLTVLHPKTIESAVGKPKNAHIAHEAARVARERTCTEKTCKRVEATLHKAKVYTKEQIAQVISRATHALDQVMVALETSLGALHLTTDDVATLKRVHSFVTRCDSTVVHEAAAGTKRALGDATDRDVLESPPRPRRGKSVVMSE
jgi:hypothetical protein